MAKFRVEVVRDECTGCETCVETCPDSYEMADDELAHLKGSKRVGSNDELDTDTLGCMKEAADACPVICIHVYEGAKKII